MGRVRVRGPEADLDEPMLVEGFPGIGLVGKIATDHLVDELEMRYLASVHCEGVPRVGSYRGGDRTVRPPVRLYASETENLLALQSDVPIGAAAAGSVARCVTDWIVDRGVTPIYLSGLPAERDDPPALYGVATGGAAERLAACDIDAPPEDGVVSGPTGALLDRAAEVGCDGVGLIVESSPRFPDPEAASVVLEAGVAPIADLSIDVDPLRERAEEIRDHREQFARRMREVSRDESTQAQPLRMYQ